MKKIIVYEENSVKKTNYRNFFQKTDYIIIETFKVEEFLIKTKKEKPILIILDLQLPIFNGIDIMNQTRTDSIYNEIRFISISSYPIKWEKEFLLYNGFSGYLQKPFTSMDLIKIVENSLKKQYDK